MKSISNLQLRVLLELRNSKAAKLKEELTEIEKEYSYEYIASIRHITITKYSHEERKKRERQKVQKEIKSYEDSKADGFIGSIFGGRSEDQKEKDDKDINKFKRKKEEEFKLKYEEEDKNIEEQIEDLQKNNPIFNPYALNKMPDDYVQFVFTVIITKLTLVILDDISDPEHEHPIAKLTLGQVKISASIGEDFQNIIANIGALNIRDYVSNSKYYRNLLETDFVGEHDDDTYDNALEIVFNNHPKFKGGYMKILMKTYSRLYIFANMPLIFKLQEFADTGEKPEDQIDLSYYTDRAKEAAIEYINLGADYIEKTSESQKNYVHQSIEAHLQILAPVIVIPEDIQKINNTKAVVINLGEISAESDVMKYDASNKYKTFTDDTELYDKYELHFTGLVVCMVEDLYAYKDWENSQRKIEIIDQVEFKISANRCIEPNHPTFPGLEAGIHIYGINIIFSDYILESLTKIQLNFTPPVKNKKGLKHPKPRAIATYISEGNTEEVEGILEEEYEEEEEEEEDEQEVTESNEDQPRTSELIDESSPLSSSNREYFTPNQSNTISYSEEDINEGGNEYSRSDSIEPSESLDENMPSHSNTEDLLYSDTQGYSDYDTEQQDDDSADQNEQEDEEEFEGESDESEAQGADEADTLDGDSQMSEESATQQIITLDRIRHDRVDMR